MGVGTGFAVLFAAAGVTAVVAVARLAKGLSLRLAKLVVCAAMLLDFCASRFPGRLDTPGQERPMSLLDPAPWAFIIWAPIFLGEITFSAVQIWFPAESNVATTLVEFTPGWAAACVSQALWCASFRPSFAPNQLWVSAVFLACIPTCLSFAHKAFISRSHPPREAVFFFPFSLHFGWTSAAALVNANCVFAYASASAGLLAVVGHVSVLMALLLAVMISITRAAPVYAFVLAWALAAVWDSMRKRQGPE